MAEYGGAQVGRGFRLQAGIPFKRSNSGGNNAGGLLLRGVVTATYVTDDAGHPQAENDKSPPIAVYCDVLVYSAIAGARWFGLRQVLVTQESGGMHSGRIWKPRATSKDLLGKLDPEGSPNPAYMDGDHVLIGFLDDCLDYPIILRAVPHPSMDFKQEDAALGRRMRLKAEDGDPNFWRHHGAYWGADKLGNFLVDTCFANDGVLQADGSEAAPPTESGKGDQTHLLPKEALYQIVVQDMANPEAPEELARLKLAKDAFQILFAAALCLKAEGSAATAKVTIGDGSHAVAIAEHLQALYNSLKSKLDAFDAHVHPTGMGPSGAPSPTIGAPSWDTAINSQRLILPAN
jgi:hypothetical protein